MIRPSTRIKLGLRAARRRRYGFAALRVLRRALSSALVDLRGWNLDPSDTRPLNGRAELQAIRALYMRGVRELRRRWPSLSLSDSRSAPR